MKRFAKGTRVVLPANEDEGIVEERGVIVGPSGPDTYLVEVDPEYRVDEFDADGLREVPVDGILVDLETEPCPVCGDPRATVRIHDRRPEPVCPTCDDDR